MLAGRYLVIKDDYVEEKKSVKEKKSCLKYSRWTNNGPRSKGKHKL